MEKKETQKHVEVIKAKEGPIIRDKRLVGEALTIMRKRVAAYVRVSTDAEEQLQSFQSQKKYYQDKISQNKQWAMVGIYADEAITGTKTDKRDHFLKMIDDCKNGLIDVVITKSISRFSRNLVDTIEYTRLLKRLGVTVIFEKENIDTSTMESEMQLALLSAMAQNEVESISQNVKMGMQMMMSRGELVGFNGCLGYDYHAEDKSLTVNIKEAETVKMIYDLYLQGFGSYTIVKHLTYAGKLNKNGVVKWTESGVTGILKNEKYKGDIRLGKTYTVDPISKRRLENRGESNQYYIRNHHEAIIEPEVWDRVQEIRKSRYRINSNYSEQTRTRYSRKYAFSGICQCAFCGTNFIRRSHMQTTKMKKPVWKCRTATHKGISNCPNSKAIDESIIENAFLEMFKLLAENFDDVLESVYSSVKDAILKDESSEKIGRLDKEITALESKQKKLTDVLLDDKISNKVYAEKNEEIIRKLESAETEKQILLQDVLSKENIYERMNKIQTKIKTAGFLDEFDRVVFESIVEKIIIGEMTEEGGVDPYKITFILKGMDDYVVENARNRYRNLTKK